jgi:methyl-accepting chemotaxis protein/ligand-binding sensor domain-containing protein
MIRRICTVAFASAYALCIPSNAHAQRLQFQKLTAENGLSSAWVSSIYQDSRGFMWFGTHNGLNRFDAYNVTSYRHKRGDSTSLAGNFVEFIQEDRDSVLWIGMQQGLTRFDRDRETFTNYPVKDGNADRTVYKMLQTKAGLILLGTNGGIFQFDKATGASTPYAAKATAGMNGPELGALLEDHRGHIWLGSHGNGLLEFDPATKSAHRYVANAADPSALPDNDVRAVVEDSAGILWIGTFKSGVVRLDPTSGAMTRIQHNAADPRSLTLNAVQTMALDGRDGLWIGTDNGGLDHLDLRTNAITHNTYDSNDEMGLNSGSIWSLFEDRNGTLWVGTYSGGVNMAKRNSDWIHSYHTVAGDVSSLSANSVIAFSQDSAGTIWVATDGGGLNRFDPASKRFIRYTMKNGGVNSDAVLAVAAEPSGAVWIGTWGGGVGRVDPASHAFTAYTTKNSNLPNDNIFALHIDRGGRLWVGTWKNGLLLFDRATKSFTAFPITEDGNNQAQIWIIEELRDGKLALGTLSQGIRIFDPATRKMTAFQTDAKDANSLSSNEIRAIREGEPGILWIGTGEGLDRLDVATKKVTHFGATDGILATAVSGIVADGNDRLWLSTDQGLTRFDPATKQGVKYTTADGLQGHDFTPRAYLHARGGAMLFGGNQGFSIVRPGSMVPNVSKPPVVLTGFQLFNKPVVVGAKGSPLARSISESKEITLGYDQSVFTFEFAALDYTAPAKNQYSYKLEGFDKDWREASNQRSAVYTNLAPGSYVFRVKASNNDGVWNDDGVSVRVTVTPPFWKTWWFRLLGLAVIAAAIYYIAKSVTERRKSLEVMNAQLAEVAERDRKSQQYLAGNVREMLGAMGRFSEGDLSVELATASDDEIGQLRVGFNTAVANIRTMVMQVHEIVTATVRASRQIQESTDALAAGAAEQTQQTSLMATAAEQMTATVADNARHIGLVAEMAQRSGRDAQKGGGVVRDTFSSMDTIVSTVALSAKTVSALGDSSKQITSITRVIDELADQTNLLALNAAIEAARAGVHGRTFAVVAEEIRDLADRTSSSTKAIAKVIQENDRAVSEAVDRMSQLSGHLAMGRHLVDQAGGALDSIIENSSKVLDSVKQVTESSEEQAATTLHLGKNIESISRVTRETAQGNQAIASSVQEMTALIEDLQTRVARFRINGTANEAEEPVNVLDPELSFDGTVPELAKG